jgi:hypothetical protein
MAKPTKWRTAELAWACGNSKWRQPESYGLTPETPLQGWAWEFLRRNALYRASVDASDEGSAERWGLAALVDYRLAFKRFSDSTRPKWLALQAFELLHGPQSLPNLKEGQVALILDLGRTLRKDVLQRQLAEFVERLWNPTEAGKWGRAVPERRQGGRTYGFASMLTYLRFADAVARNQDIDSEELQQALGFTSTRAPKQLHEAHSRAILLIDRDYRRLVAQELPPLRSIASPWRRKPAPVKNPRNVRVPPTADASWE